MPALRLKRIGFKAFSAIWIAFVLLCLMLCIMGFGLGVTILSMQGKWLKAALMLIVGFGFLFFGIFLLRYGLRTAKAKLSEIERTGK